MTSPHDPAVPWMIFQSRVKAAISRAADHHETLGNLLTDLNRCEDALRGAQDPVGCLDGVSSPAAIELRAALDDHVKEDLVQFDGTCAANIVLAVMNALLHAAKGPES